MNLFIIGSPWHAALANAIVLKEKISDAVFFVECITEQSLLQIKEALNHQISEVFYHEKTRFESIKKNGLTYFLREMPSEFKRIESVTSNLPKKEIHRIFYFNFYSPITRKIIFELEKNLVSRNITRVEDGICDYFNFNFINHSKIQSAIKGAMSLILGRHALYKRSNKHLYEITSEYYCFYPEKISPSWKKKDTRPLSGYSEEIKRNFQASKTASTDKAETLIIGQTLFEDGIISLLQEVSIYKEAANLLPKPAKLKPHPRSSEEKINALELAGIPLLRTKLSAESLIANGDYKIIVGMWSNTIIYSLDIFGIKSYTMNHSLIDKSNKGSSHLTKIHKTLCLKFKDQYRDYREIKAEQ